LTPINPAFAPETGMPAPVGLGNGPALSYDPPVQIKRRALGLPAAAWAAGVLYFTSQDLAYLPHERGRWLHLLGLNAVQVSVWALLIVPAIAFMKRWPLDGPRRLRHWAAFAPMVLALVCTGLWAAFVISLGSEQKPLFSGPGYKAGLIRFFTLYFHFYFLTFVSALFAYYAYLWRRRFRDGALQASRLEAQLFQAQNQALRMQIQPHFLFNTLHSISTLMHSDVEAADRMITRLGDLLRTSLDQSRQQELPLGQELAFLGAYLEIEGIRFQDRLRVAVEVPAALRDAMVPTFILQPLVENALKHGLSRRKRGCTVAIRAREENGALLLEVEDDGEGPPSSYQEGVGLRSVRERLSLLHGGQGVFTFHGSPGQGALAALRMPLRSAP
jgi:hypothetical protein